MERDLGPLGHPRRCVNNSPNPTPGPPEQHLFTTLEEEHERTNSRHGEELRRSPPHSIVIDHPNTPARCLDAS
jgi:hypothetical protein